MQSLGCIWLSETARLAPAHQAALLRACSSAEEILGLSVVEAQQLCGGLNPAEIRRFSGKSLRRAAEIARKCGDRGWRILTFYDEDFPKPLRHIPDPPAVLYVQGRLPDFSSVLAIAVVGKRKASAYGLHIAEQMGYDLSRAGAVVVSGMAEGCDGAAHRGALAGGTPTVAVLGTPLDRCFPASNAALMRNIAAYGALVTEYPPGRPYTASDFPRRNRLICGLAQGLVVCEAGKKSGTLLTARLALDQGRDVFAVPGAVGAANSEGTNELIASSGAQLVTSAQRILDEYAPRLQALGIRPAAPAAAEPPGPPPAAPAPPQGKSIAAAFSDTAQTPAQQSLLQVLNGTMHIDDLIEASGVSAAEALEALTFLEIAGLVRRLPGKRFERT